MCGVVLEEVAFVKHRPIKPQMGSPFYPKHRVDQHNLRRPFGFKGYRPLFVFFLFNAIPLALVIFALRDSIEQSQHQLENDRILEGLTGEEIALEATKVCKSTSKAILLSQPASLSQTIYPADPEARLLSFLTNLSFIIFPKAPWPTYL